MKRAAVGVLALSLLPFAIVVACAKKDSGAGFPVEEDQCTPGKAYPCYCAGNVKGEKTCNDDQKSFSECLCGHDASASHPPVSKPDAGARKPTDGGKEAQILDDGQVLTAVCPGKSITVSTSNTVEVTVDTS